MIALTCDQVRDLAPAYVLGALERAEEQAVAAHLATCPDAHAELAELGGAVAHLASAVTPVEPPAALKGRIMAAAAADLAQRTPAPGAVQARHAAPARQAEPAAQFAVPAPVISFDAARRRRGLGSWAVGLAAVLAIVTLGAWGFTSQQQLADARSYQTRLTAVLAQAGQPGSQVAILASTGAAGSGPSGLAVMPVSGPGTMLISGLSATTGSQVYEAWAIVAGRPPAPVAGFTVTADGIGYLDRMPSATGESVTVAITLEPAPNATAPSSAPIAAGVAGPAAT